MPPKPNRNTEDDRKALGYIGLVVNCITLLCGEVLRDNCQHGCLQFIRPLLYCAERDIAAYAEQMDFPILPCNLCGSQDNLWRQQVKQMLDNLEQRAPQVRQSMLAALKNVHTSHLLGPS